MLRPALFPFISCIIQGGDSCGKQPTTGLFNAEMWTASRSIGVQIKEDIYTCVRVCVRACACVVCVLWFKLILMWLHSRLFYFLFVVLICRYTLVYFYFFQVLWVISLLKPTGHVMHQQFNIQQLYALPTLYLCVLYLSENKQRLVPLTA